MGIENERDPSFDGRLRHLRIGENRVAEMECHVQSLRERLCRLERMLPPQYNNIERPQFEEDVCKGIKDDTVKVCPIDELAKKEKLLRRQIYNMECTEKKYIRQLADLKEEKTEEQKNNANDNPNSPTKKNHDIRKERLLILESCSQKLNTNLLGIRKTHANLAQEAQNLSQVLDKTRKSCTETPRETENVSPCGQAKEKTVECSCNVECSCKKVPKCNSCIICSCDDWEKDLMNNKEESTPKLCTIDKNTPLKRCVCHCYEMLSSSDSDESCEDCKNHQKKPSKNACCYNHQDAESESSDCSIDGNTIYSEKSKCICCCNKNDSHEACEDNVSPKRKKPERFRGGVDAIVTNTIVANLESTQKEPNDFPSLDSSIFDNLKLVKVDEIREGLERLKIRNRNLKDFLNNLEEPLTLMSKPSEVTSICTQVSSCYTLDIARQTRSGLLTVVKVLEGRCRNKDAIIIALVDELKTGSNNKIRLKGTEPGIEKIKNWKTISPDKKIRRMFTKKDSAFGFALIALILISHMKKSEVISYLLAAKKILTESSFQLVLFLIKSGKFSTDFLFDYYEKAKNLIDIYIKNINSKSNEIILWLTELSKSLSIDWRDNFNVALPYVTDNWIYVISIVGIVSVILLIPGFIAIRLKYFKPPISEESTKELNLFQYIIAVVIRYLRIIHDHIFSSRIFWLILGFCCHILWDIIESNFINFIDLLNTLYTGETRSNDLKESQQPLPFTEEPVCELFDFLNCTWIVSMFSTKLQDFVELSYQIFKDIVD